MVLSLISNMMKLLLLKATEAHSALHRVPRLVTSEPHPFLDPAVSLPHT